MSKDGPTPDHIMELGFGFQASKTLLTAVELGVFDALAAGSKTRADIENELGLHPRGSEDFLDALVALDVLDRENGQYRNTPASDAFLVSGKPSYIGGVLERANDRLYGFWGDLEETLRTGRPTNELEDGQTHPFEEAIYQSDENLKQFVGAMTGLSMGVDLPRVEPHFREFTSESPATDRIKFRTGGFFGTDPLSSADVYVLGHILHDWSIDRKQEILTKVSEAVNPGGTVIVYGTMIDEERREAEMPLLMSLNMVVETPNGFDYTPSQCIQWLHESGFEGGEARELPGPETMVLARK